MDMILVHVGNVELISGNRLKNVNAKLYAREKFRHRLLNGNLFLDVFFGFLRVLIVLPSAGDKLFENTVL